MLTTTTTTITAYFFVLGGHNPTLSFRQVVLFRSEFFYGVLIWIFVYVYITLYAVTYPLSGFTWVFDFITRVDLNESFLNTFNFFWTSFLYLPLFFSVWFLLFWLLSNLRYHPVVLFLGLGLFTAYSFESLDTLTLSYHADCFDLDNSAVNLLLSNNLNKYHPFLFYMSVALGSGLMLRGGLGHFETLLFCSNTLSSYYGRYITATLVLNLTSLFMGSWWALQEGTWGGWWNWDASEVLGLLVTMGALYHLHSSYSVATVSQVQNRLTLLGLIVLLSYAFIQLNFDLVSHNFGSKFFFFFNNNLFLLELMLFTLGWIGLGTVKVYTLQSQIVTLFFNSPGRRAEAQEVWWILFTFYVVLGSLLGSSFLPLLNYFIWSYFGLNSFNFHLFRPLLVTLVLLSLLLVFAVRYIGGKSTLLGLWLGVDTHPLVGLFTRANISPSLVTPIHLSLGLMALSNLSSYDCSFIQWYDYGVFQELCLSYSPTFTKQTSFICDSFWIESATLYTTSYYCDSTSWNVFYWSNTCSLQTFLLQYNNATLYNLYSLSSGWANSTLVIELNYLNNLFEAGWVLVFYTLLHCYYSWISVRTNY